MEIRNLTVRPLKIKLPGDKLLRLGPKATGQITAKAADFPPVKALLEDGTIEIVGDGGHKGVGGTTTTDGPSSNQKPMGGGGMRRSGDR